MHAPLRIPFWHLLVQNAAAGGHPLNVPGGHPALVAQAVSVRHLSSQHIRDGLDSAVRVPRKPGNVVCRILVSKIVEQQKWIEFLGLSKPEGALQFDACPFKGWRCFKNLLHRTKRHV